jgi:N-acetylglucosamine kinase-like BadF-type ATPase
MKLFAGFDGGGTKTECVLVNEQGAKLGRGFGGESNFLFGGRETAAKSTIDALGSAFSDAGLVPQKLECAYVSSAAIKTYCGKAHEPFFREFIDCDKLVLEGDIYPIWYGVCGETPAIVQVSGTGAITYLFRKAEYIRVDGWGPTLGDEGSGYWLGLEALKTTLRIYDGREAPDEEFCARILKTMNASKAVDLIGILRNSPDRSLVASAARPVCELAVNGNSTAITLAEMAAQKLEASILAALRRDKGADTLSLVLWGGLLRKGSPVAGCLEKRLKGESRIAAVIYPAHSTAVVSAALALKACGLDSASRQLLREDAQ